MTLASPVVSAAGQDRPEAPRVVAEWPAGLMEVRAALDGPADPAVARVIARPSSAES
jgi:hypothetical protein